MPRHPLCVMSIGLLAAAAAQAQTPTPPVLPAPPNAPVHREIVLDMPRADLVSDERVVKGAPYCADAIRESIQVLPDASGQPGNRIVQQSQSRLCRDGEGRTRQEVERGSRKQVILRDPVAREAWVLDDQRRTARRMGPGASAWSYGLLDSAGWQDYAERMREWAKGFAERSRAAAGAASAPPMPPTPGQAELVLLSRQAQEAAQAAQREAQAFVLRLDGGSFPFATPPSAPLPPLAVSLAAHRFAPRGGGVVTALGSKDIEGVRANGERTTWTIEAGKVGNEKPIETVREVWTAPELSLTVLVREFDPRRGESVYRLANLRRGEPDAALMKVPSDYNRTR